MILALVPLRDVPDPVAPSQTIREPALPNIPDLRWGQASSLWTPQGMVLVWIDANEKRALTLVRDHGVGLIGDRVRWTERDHNLMRARHPRTQDLIDATREIKRGATAKARTTARIARRNLLNFIADAGESARRDCVAAYREVAEVVERQAFSKREGVHALSVISSDYFQNLTAGADVNGTTMDGGGGGATNVWVAASSILGTTLSGDKMLYYYAGSGFKYGYDNTMDVTARLRVHALPGVAGCGPAARMSKSTTAPDCYVADSTGSPMVRLLRVDAGSRTALGYGSSFTVVEDDVAVDCNGTSISALLLGATDVGPSTDSNYADGVAGIQMYESNYLSDWYAEGEAAASAHALICGMRRRRNC